MKILIYLFFLKLIPIIANKTINTAKIGKPVFFILAPASFKSEDWFWPSLVLFESDSDGLTGFTGLSGPTGLSGDSFFCHIDC